MKSDMQPISVHDILASIEYGNADEVIIFMNKINYVNQRHKNAISHHTPTSGEPLDYYYTRLPNKKKLKGVTEKILIEKLYEYYIHDDVDYTFKSMFKAALESKKLTENPKEKTIADYEASYKRFISQEFESQDIRQMQPSFVKEYIQRVTQEQNPTKKALYKFKGVLNMVFNYATDPERMYITVNPVPAKNGAYTKNCKARVVNPEQKAFQPEDIKLIKRTLWERVENTKYDVNGYAILFSIETGVREGEIPSLMWADVYPDRIHVHSQQNDRTVDGVKEYYYNPSTKNEKGVSLNGRFIPMNQNTRLILSKLKEKQIELGIKSDWVFAKLDGTWITTVSYSKALYRLCKGDSSRGTTGLGLSLSNNHAFRMALNSYVFIPMGLPATERAKILGHSVETNLKHYTFARSDDYLSEISKKWDSFNDESVPEVTDPHGTTKIIKFKNKKSSQAQ